MLNEPKQPKINWYRTPVDRKLLAELNQRSDFWGLLQTGGHLGLLALTGAAAFYAAAYLPVWVLLLILFVHGTFYAFLLNGFHELCHSTVFKTKWLNVFFLYVFSFLGSFNHVFFWTSHQEHHKYTLHPPDDLEVMLPFKITYAGFWKSAFANPWGFYQRVKGIIRLSQGRLEGDWEQILFPATEPDKRRRLFGWSRFLLIGHTLLLVVSLSLSLWLGINLWLLPVLITLGPFYGGWLLFLCNNTQHVGLQDNVSDYRLCTRTFRVNPFVQFLYWHMNYHIEHHMYAAVPCYKLGKLHRAIQHDLPPTPVGLIATWREIIPIVRQQQIDPTYQYLPALPTPTRA